MATLEEMLPTLKAGVPLRRVGWREGLYMHIPRGSNLVVLSDGDDWHPTVWDLDGDWEVHEERVEVSAGDIDRAFRNARQLQVGYLAYRDNELIELIKKGLGL